MTDFVKHFDENIYTKLYIVTGPPEHWITAYTKKVWGFPDNKINERKWLKMHAGYIVFFHSTKESRVTKNAWGGIIGVGIVEDIRQKDENWWYEEKKENKNIYSLIIKFSDVFFFGEAELIDKKDIGEKTEDEIKNDIKNLLKNYFELSEIKNFFSNTSIREIDRYQAGRIIEHLKAIELFRKEGGS